MKILLPRLPRIIQTKYGVVVTYDRLYQGAVNGTLPIEAGDNGRYSAEETDLPQIVAKLGLQMKATPATPALSPATQRRKAAA